MGTNIYQLSKSLGKFRALRTSSVGNSEFYGEIYDKGMDQYNNGCFEANIYTNGKLKDIEINGWTFSFHIKGTYHVPGSYTEINYYIEAIDPKGSEVRLYNYPYYAVYSDEVVLCSFLDLISTYSSFDNADIAIKFYQLIRSIEGVQPGCRSEDKNITIEVGFAQAKFFKEYYKIRNVETADKYIMKLIKESVNKAVDRFKKKIDTYKIED